MSDVPEIFKTIQSLVDQVTPKEIETFSREGEELPGEAIGEVSEAAKRLALASFKLADQADEAQGSMEADRLVRLADLVTGLFWAEVHTMNPEATKVGKGWKLYKPTAGEPCTLCGMIHGNQQDNNEAPPPEVSAIADVFRGLGLPVEVRRVR